MAEHSAKSVACSRPGDREKLHEERRKKISKRMEQIEHKLIVLSGKGGVGKSTVAAYLAIALALKGKKVGLMDADIHGPSIPKMLALEGRRITAEGDAITPIRFSENLKVMSIAFLLRSGSDAIIWRGPLKMGLIEEFLANVDWGPLDYLIIDSPPGTGDEPLSVCQMIPDLDGAVIITTPQEIALADVEKSITFCRAVHTRVVGVIENMSGFICPHCGHEVDIFKRGGAERLAGQVRVPFLGRIPILPEVVDACDRGACSIDSVKSPPFREALGAIIEGIVAAVSPSGRAYGSSPSPVGGRDRSDVGGVEVKRIALPLDGDRLSAHFGHSTRFAIYCVEGGEITGERFLTPPPHAPGVIPSWLRDQGVTVVIAGGLGRKAMAAFEKSGITVLCGASPEAPRDLVSAYLKGGLVTGENVCDH